MNYATLLFPGGHLKTYVVDYALDWATENEGELKAIFIINQGLAVDSYSPTDKDHHAALLRNSFEEVSLPRELESETRYIEKRAMARHVRMQVQVMVSPDSQQLIKELSESDMLFIDKNIDEDPDANTVTSPSIDEIRNKVTRIFPVGEYDRYSDVFY